jgi:hypothetical protein
MAEEQDNPLRRLLRAVGIGREHDIEEAEAFGGGHIRPIWCVAAAVVDEPKIGEWWDFRSAERYFAPKSKLYAYEFFWGRREDLVRVIGHQYGTHKYIAKVIYASDVTGWHAATTQNPWIIERLRKRGEFADYPPDSSSARLRAEQIAQTKTSVQSAQK